MKYKSRIVSAIIISVFVCGLIAVTNNTTSQAASITSNWNIGGDPGEMTVSADGTKVFAVDSNNNRVDVINTADGTNESITVGSTPDSLALSPNGAKLYVVNNGSNTISIIDVASLAVTTTISVCTSPYQIAITPNNA